MQNTAVLSIARRAPTEEEQQRLAVLTKGSAKLEVLLPDQIDAVSWKSDAAMVCRSLVRSMVNVEILMPVLGRLLVIAKATPDITAGYESWDEFLKNEVIEKFGVGRSTCFEAMRNQQRFPEIGPGDYKLIGRIGMKIVNKAIPKEQEKEPFARAVIEAAKTMSNAELETFCVEKGYIERGEAIPAFLKIPCNQAQFRRITKFLKNAEYHAFCETKGNQAVLLEKAIIEACVEWDKQLAEQEREASKKAS